MSLPAEPKERARVLARAMRVIYDSQNGDERITRTELSTRLDIDAFGVEVAIFELSQWGWVSKYGGDRISVTLKGATMVAMAQQVAIVFGGDENP